LAELRSGPGEMATLDSDEEGYMSVDVQPAQVKLRKLQKLKPGHRETFHNTSDNSSFSNKLVRSCSVLPDEVVFADAWCRARHKLLYKVDDQHGLPRIRHEEIGPVVREGLPANSAIWTSKLRACLILFAPNLMGVLEAAVLVMLEKFDLETMRAQSASVWPISKTKSSEELRQWGEEMIALVREAFGVSEEEEVSFNDVRTQEGIAPTKHSQSVLSQLKRIPSTQPFDVVLYQSSEQLIRDSRDGQYRSTSIVKDLLRCTDFLQYAVHIDLLSVLQKFAGGELFDGHQDLLRAGVAANLFSLEDVTRSLAADRAEQRLLLETFALLHLCARDKPLLAAKLLSTMTGAFLEESCAKSNQAVLNTVLHRQTLSQQCFLHALSQESRFAAQKQAKAAGRLG
jgi:hypothetical protein